MDKKAERLRYKYDDSIQFYQLPIDRDLFTKFKAQCVKGNVSPFGPAAIALWGPVALTLPIIKRS